MRERFELIEAAVRLHSEKAEEYNAAVPYIGGALREMLGGGSGLTAVNHRVKTAASLTEKIYRKQTYKTCRTPEELLRSMRDCLGFMAECRFASEEKGLHGRLISHFGAPGEDGYAACERYPGLELDLGQPQPQLLLNGVHTYKLDGRLKRGGIDIVFELQIKSLVNRFWSDVEHNVVYKNNGYFHADNYFVQLLENIRGNLLGIDDMLRVIQEQIESQARPVAESLDLSDLIGRLIGELMNGKMSETMGVFIRTRRTAELLARVLVACFPEDEDSLKEGIASLSVRIESLSRRSVDLRKEIDYPEGLGGFADKLFALAREDFEWHLFFVFYQLPQPYGDAGFSRAVSVLEQAAEGADEITFESLSKGFTFIAED